tara:strand:+ start:653 stop:1051 length:399 start_codon:yes stop_codon:yes gene_type:complete
MILKFLRVIFLITSFVFLSGFLPFASLLGPGVTIASSGNVYKAGIQYIIDSTIKKKTGKNSLALVKEEVKKQNNKRDFNQGFKKLVEKRIALTNKKLIEQNNQKKLNEGLKKLIEKRFAIVQKKLIIKRFSQ